MDHCTQVRLYISIFRALTVGDISVLLIRLKRVYLTVIRSGKLFFVCEGDTRNRLRCVEN